MNKGKNGDKEHKNRNFSCISGRLAALLAVLLICSLFVSACTSDKKVTINPKNAESQSVSGQSQTGTAAVPENTSQNGTQQNSGSNAIKPANVQPAQQSTMTPTLTPGPANEKKPKDPLQAESVAAPTPEPTAVPTAEPTAAPTAEPTQEPAAEPTQEPAAEPTQEPEAEPTQEPAAEPAQEPAAEPTQEPAAEPAQEPAEEPVQEPAEEPVQEPAEEPVTEPEEEPEEDYDDYEEGDEWRTVIVLDPGHSAVQKGESVPIGPGASEMKDGDAVGTSGAATGKMEYELNMEICQKLQSELENRGYKVILTHTDNETAINFYERAMVANRANADCFIRIHADGSASSADAGASAICITSSNPWTADTYGECRRLSGCVLSSYCKATGIEKRGIIEEDNMTGNNWSAVPTTLLEMGFMTNPDEDLLMTDPDFQWVMVQGIADGIDAFFNGSSGEEEEEEEEEETEEENQDESADEANAAEEPENTEDPGVTEPDAGSGETMPAEDEYTEPEEPEEPAATDETGGEEYPEEETYTEEES